MLLFAVSSQRGYHKSLATPFAHVSFVSGVYVYSMHLHGENKGAKLRHVISGTDGRSSNDCFKASNARNSQF